MRWPLLALPFLVMSPIIADEKEELVAKQKAMTATILKKIDSAKSATIETPDLIVCGFLPEDRVKAIGESAQKQFSTVLKVLKFEMTDNPPKGKLAIYLFPERRQLAAFSGDVVGDRLEKDERSHCSAVGNEPFVAVSVLPGEKPTDLDAEALNQIAVVLLRAKGNVPKLPTWMEDGFVRAMKWRTDPKLTGERTRARTLLFETKVKPSKYKLADAWTPTADKDKPLISASLVEYFVFGPEAPKLSKLLAGFRTVEGDPAPTVDAALKGADFDVTKLDAAWKKWTQTGK